MKKCTRKVCAKKGVWQPTSNFSKCKWTRDGLARECMDCKKEISRATNEREKQKKKDYFSMFIGNSN